MAEAATYSVSRVPVAPEPWVQLGHDYADSFELRLARPDTHTAEEWMRAALESAAPAVSALIRFVHTHVAGFALSSDPHSVLGWDTVSSTPDAFHVETHGPALRADIVARRTSDRTATVTTFLFYQRRRTALLWMVIGPLHRRIAPYLLARAASKLTRLPVTPSPMSSDPRPVVQLQEIPEGIRRLCPFDPDYADLFVAPVPDAPASSPERWARATMEGAPAVGRFLAWRVLCHLRLQSSPEHIAGWRVADRRDNWIRVEASSWSMTANIVFKIDEDRVLFGTFIRYQHPGGKAIWTPVSAVHRAVAPEFLRGGMRRILRARLMTER